MKKIISLNLLLLLFSFASCQNQNGNHNAGVINTNLPVDVFAKKLAESPTVQLVDVRTPEEFSQGHLKGAVNYDINGADFDGQLAKLDKSKPVLVYCLSGGRSASAAEKMEEKGFREVYNMKGGIMKWNAANQPIEKGSGTLSEGLSLSDFNSMVKKDKMVLVDFRAKWCKPCQKMAPMLDALAEKKKDKLILLKIDADENKNLLKEKKIDAIPVLELYKDGKLVWSHQGEIDEATLLKESKL